MSTDPKPNENESPEADLNQAAEATNPSLAENDLDGVAGGLEIHFRHHKTNSPEPTAPRPNQD